MLIDDAKIYVKDGSMQDIVLNILLKFVKVLLIREKFFNVFIFKILFTMIKMELPNKKLQKNDNLFIKQGCARQF